MNLHQLAKNIIYLLKRRYRQLKPKRIINYSDSSKLVIGRALVSYIPGSLIWSKDDPRFRGHTNLWESAEIARILVALGYVVDAISHEDDKFVSQKKYDIVFDIHRNLQKYSNNTTKKILHATGSFNVYSNIAERQRLVALSQRRGANLVPRRAIPKKSIEDFLRNALAADVITLVGNEVTKATFPDELQKKIKCIPVTGSLLKWVRNCETQSLVEREYLWFGGSGAVHKGLDLVIEAFSKMPELILHIIGPIETEVDFINEYKRELSECRNIIMHGYLFPSEERFRLVTGKVVGFILPSCSEGTSTAAITCMQYGLIPIVSKDCGVDITPERGILLKECTITEIIAAIQVLDSMGADRLRKMAGAAQSFAVDNHSRQQFSSRMKIIFRDLIS